MTKANPSMFFPGQGQQGLFDDEKTYVLFGPPHLTILEYGYFVHPDFQYVLAEIDGKTIMLKNSFLSCRNQGEKSVSWDPGRKLEGIRCPIPL